jgi:hypothetical protein
MQMGQAKMGERKRQNFEDGDIVRLGKAKEGFSKEVVESSRACSMYQTKCCKRTAAGGDRY